MCVYLQQLTVISTVTQYILVGAERQSWARNRWNRRYKLWHKTLSYLVNPKAFLVARVHLENTDSRTVEDRHCAQKATRMRHKNLSSIPHLQLSILKCLWGISSQIRLSFWRTVCSTIQVQLMSNQWGHPKRVNTRRRTFFLCLQFPVQFER